MYRLIDCNFNKDNKVSNRMSRDERYFFLSLLITDQSNQLGIFEINKKMLSYETDFSIKEINEMLDKFDHELDIIKYSEETDEIAIKNYLNYQVITGGKPIINHITKHARAVKNKALKLYVYNALTTETRQKDVFKDHIIPLLLEDTIDNENDYENEKENVNGHANDYEHDKKNENEMKMKMTMKRSGVETMTESSTESDTESDTESRGVKYRNIIEQRNKAVIQGYPKNIELQELWFEYLTKVIDDILIDEGQPPMGFIETKKMIRSFKDSYPDEEDQINVLSRFIKTHDII